MAMVNQVVNTPMFNPNVKDSRWLTLEVCREYTRNKCTRTENECKFAHPPAHVEVQNGRVTCCFDSIKGKCQRKDPPCKYLHPPQHLKEQLLQNGRNNLILKNLQMQALTASLQPVMPSIYSPVLDGYHPEGHSYPKAYVNMYYEKAPPPYLVQNPTAAFSPYSVMSPTLTGVPNMIGQTVDTTSGAGGVPVSAAQVTSVMPNAAPMAQQKLPRADRLEPSTSLSSNGSDPSMWAGSQAESVLSSSHTYSPVYLQVCREYQRSTCTRQPSECRFAHPPDNVTVDTTDNHVTVCMDFIKGKCSRDSCRYFHPPPHLQAQIKAAQQRANAAAVQAHALGLQSVPGVATQPVMKRAAVADSKSGVPMYHPSTGSAAAYQTALAAMQLQQPPFVPVTIPGHPAVMPRF